ncbi:hypothetical protein E4U57_006138 [Claviceps arundinis]|uniref:Rab-GAP TBC domain-containing protein n=1 Tax=Claviceps arundinis TaxID=1623583 RepID=A0ABQ7PL52_9HYPO|nr:hypothetical protein E4U57_006138 [Claviceps arundinis]
MRSLEETRSRWQITQKHNTSLDELQSAVRNNGCSSPCLVGCRSVCWKVFLLSNEASQSSWIEAVEGSRRDYQASRDHLLKYIQHPEALNELAIDPLADDPESPWNTVRQDEITRAEIQQDVLRLPDEANYHEQGVQGMILDILFIYCKSNPERGGYRQGMHELLAPIVYTLQEDSIDRGAVDTSSEVDQSMLDVLDSAFIEHDAYTLFSRLMAHAQSFYEVTEGELHPRHAARPTSHREQRSAIVDRSKYIHEVCLRKVDPELAAHLSNVEILPQIFIIRWVRLLFSREFPFDQFLVLWDTIFALDPSLEVVDLICVAMLIRIRQQLLEADYSVCLQLLLKYPSPEQPHGPHTFVDDAVYLRDHLDRAGGSSLIMKYTGKMPDYGSEKMSSSSSRNGGRTARSRLSPPLRLMQQQPTVETFLQGAAKGANRMLEKGEKLGINQAVRDAVDEIRRNVQSFNEVRQAQRSSEEGTEIAERGDGAVKALAAMERRNMQLASLLRDTVADLKTVTLSEDADKAKNLELIEVVAAKIQFVQIYLEDSSMDVPAFEPPVAGSVLKSETEDASVQPTFPTEEATKAPVDDTKNKPDESMTGVEKATILQAPDADVPALRINDHKSDSNGVELGDVLPAPNGTTTNIEDEDIVSRQPPELKIPEHQPEPDGPEITSVPKRPAAVPTRSTLAQSSFSWMLEPDESLPSRSTLKNGPISRPTRHKKRSSNHTGRERNAFLFGDVAGEVDGVAALQTEDVFGLEPIPKTKTETETETRCKSEDAGVALPLVFD